MGNMEQVSPELQVKNNVLPFPIPPLSVMPHTLQPSAMSSVLSWSRAVGVRREWTIKALMNEQVRCRDKPFTMVNNGGFVCPFDELEITAGQDTRTFYPGSQESFQKGRPFCHAHEACANMAHRALRTILYSLPQEDMDALCRIYHDSEILKAAINNRNTSAPTIPCTEQCMEHTEPVSSIHHHLSSTLAGIIYPAWTSEGSCYITKVNHIVASIRMMSASESMRSAKHSVPQTSSSQPKGITSKVTVTDSESGAKTDLSTLNRWLAPEFEWCGLKRASQGPDIGKWTIEEVDRAHVWK